MLHRLSMGCLAVAVSVAALAGARAQEITLRVADSLPAGFPQTEYSSIFWMNRVTEATNGKVKFEHFPGEQLGKARDLLSLTLSGVADVGYIVPAFVSDKLPLNAVAELPGAFGTTCEGVKAYWELISKGVLAEKELAPQNLKAVFAALNPPYQVWTRNKQIGELADFSGLKLRAASGGQAILVERLDAAPINMSGPDIYESISRGTIDGILFPVTGIVGYDLGAQVKYGITGENFGDVVTFHAMALDKWNALPDDVKTAMEEAGEAATLNACARLQEDAEKNAQQLKDAGVTFSPLSATAHEALAGIQREVADAWAKGMDERGLAGTEALTAFREALKAE